MIACHLNERRIFTRDGGRWGIGQIHRVLRRSDLCRPPLVQQAGQRPELKSTGEMIVVAVPPLIDPAAFDAVQARPRSRNPR